MLESQSIPVVSRSELSPQTTPFPSVVSVRPLNESSESREHKPDPTPLTRKLSTSGSKETEEVYGGKVKNSFHGCKSVEFEKMSCVCENGFLLEKPWI
jgi:hypothetical protein